MSTNIPTTEIEVPRMAVVEGGTETLERVLATGYRCTRYVETPELTQETAAFYAEISDASGKAILEIRNSGTGGPDMRRALDREGADRFWDTAQEMFPDCGPYREPADRLESILMTHKEISDQFNRIRNVVLSDPEGGDSWITGGYAVVPKTSTRNARIIWMTHRAQVEPHLLIWDRHTCTFRPIKDVLREAMDALPHLNPKG